MASRKKQLLIYLTLVALLATALGSKPLPSNFYQPGAGAIVESWLSTSSYSFENFKNIPDFPGCPTYVGNANNFEHSNNFGNKHQQGRYRAVFVSTQSGKHIFFAICKKKCQVYISMNPNGLIKVLDINTQTNDNWNERKSSIEIDILKGFRYEIVAYHYGARYTTGYFRLGVKFPDTTEVKPINSNYIRRSMEFYKWNGLIAQKYDNFNFPSWSMYSLAYAYSNNPNYPNNPTSFTCKSTLYDQYQYQDFGNKYALRYIGYMKVPSSSSYQFKMWCNELCEFFITKNNVETSLGSFVIRDYINPNSRIMNGGQLSPGILYPIKAFMAENSGKDYIRVQHKKSSGGYSGSWSGMLQNLETVETSKSFPVPVATMINSTAISVKLPTAPYLPPNDSWTYIPNHEILYFIVGFENNVQKKTLNGNLPQTLVATGLKKYTDYKFYAHYFGTIGGKDQNIISAGAIMKTDEDVPETAPPNLAASQQSSTSIKVTWRTFTDLKLWNGIGIGFEIQYRVKDATPNTWTPVLTSGVGNRQYVVTSLKKYTIYEFRVAGRTSKGSGVFSAIIEERTAEDVPSAPPSNINAQNTSSSSISITWNDVPADHQNGVITGYNVYIKISTGDSPWDIADVTAKTFAKSGLDLWTLYYVRVSAKTSVGEGTISNALGVWTDEDKPSAPPTSVNAIAMSSESINVTWSEITPSKTHGIIVSYTVKYERVDRKEPQKETITNVKSALIASLDQDVEYEIEVAGMTRKGVGVFSPKIKMKTLESAPRAPPANLTGHYENSTAIRVNWRLVPAADQNGVISSYTVMYKKKGGFGEWKIATVDRSYLTLIAKNLDFYTMYEFKVAASTAIGRGPFSDVIDIRTDADGPTRPPMNLTGHFLDHKSIEMTWRRVPNGFRHGVIFGYKLHYKDISIPEQPWKNISIKNRLNGTDIFNVTVSNLKIYTQYSFKIQAFTKTDGVFSDEVIVRTDEYQPKEYPQNITGQNGSSTEITLQWKEMEEVDGDANGKVLGYIVKFRVVDCHEDRPEGCDENHVFNITSNGNFSEIKIPKLRKFTKYSLSVQVFNSKGKGNFSKEIEITTAEDKPDASPTIVETWPSKSSEIAIYWSPIPESLRNGIILGYRIFYKPIDTALHRYNRAPRAINPLAVYGAEPGEKMVEVNSTTFEVEIAELKNYSWYRVRIGAFTSKGLGVTFSINGTTKQGSPTEAPELQVTDMFGFHEILLNWKQISKSAANGEVLGYIIEYWLTELMEVQIPETKTSYVEVFEPNRTVIIKGLQAFARYGIRILAFTEGGFGVWSKEYNGDTCRCPEMISSARISLPPLTHAANLEILPLVIDDAVTSCCGNCSGRHGTSYVNWQKDGLNSSSIKYSKKEALDAISRGTDLALPIFKDSFESTGDVDKSTYVFVPLIPSKYLVIFMKSHTEKALGNAASSLVTESVMEQWPLIALSTVITLLAGIFFWILESGTNTDEFSDSYIRGSGSGIWLAYITMTTVGYGDLVPITKLGRIYTVVWSLLGLVLTSLVVGNISSSLSIDFVFNGASLSTDGKVLTSEESIMLAAQLYGGKTKIGNVSDGNYVQQSLLSGKVGRVALEVYRAGTLKDYLNHPDIVLEKVEKIEASYGVALGGETKRIKNCLRRHVKENQQQTFEKIAQKRFLYQIAAARDSGLIDHMLSPHSDIMENLTMYGGILLLVFVVLGVLYEIINYIRTRSKVETLSTKLDNMADEIIEGMTNLERKLDDKFSELERKHTKEILAINRMQYGKNMALVYMYPTLHMFDPELPRWKQDQNRQEFQFSKNGKGKDYVSDDDSDIDMPIDYKTDSYF